MEAQIQIVLIDDHAVLRAGLRMLLNAEEDMHVTGEAADAEQGTKLVADLHPNVVLLDISMPDATGLSVLREMKAQAPDSRIIILTMHNDEGYLRLAMSSGASGYVLKQAANNELLAAIRVVSQGGTYLHPIHKTVLFEGKNDRSGTISAGEEDYNRLSAREKEILRLIAMGYTNRQSAEELFLSEKTIETYKARLMAKLDLHTRTDLVRFALRLGIIKS